MRYVMAACAAVLLAAGSNAAEKGFAKGTPEVKSINALAFGTNGMLFVGDQSSASIIAIETGDTAPGGKDDVKIDKLDEKIANTVGAMANQIKINDVKVNPASGNIYIAAAKAGTSMIFKLTRDGKMAEFSLKDVSFSASKLTGASDGKGKQTSITSLAYIDGKVIVAGLSNEEFASTLRVIPFPFSKVDEHGSMIEIFHGAHGKLETRSPIQTFTPYKISGADYLVAAYTCTPLVKLPVSDLKAGTKVKGTTIAELGSGNKPLDIIVYSKDSKEYLLIANNKRGVMKMPTAGMDSAAGIDKPAKSPSGMKYETVKELTGVLHLDKLDDTRALILVEAEDKSISLKSVPLP